MRQTAHRSQLRVALKPLERAELEFLAQLRRIHLLTPPAGEQGKKSLNGGAQKPIEWAGVQLGVCARGGILVITNARQRSD